MIARLHAAGSEQVAIAVACAAAERGHDSSVVAISRPRRYDDVYHGLRRMLAEAGVRYVEFPAFSYRRAALEGGPRLARLFRGMRPDIVHAHSDRPDFAVSVASRLSSFRAARTIHNTMLWETHGIAGRIAEWGYHDDLVAFVSMGARRAYLDLRARYGLPPSTFQRHIPNGVPAAQQPASRADLVLDLGVDAGCTLLAFAGRFTPQKGFDVLLSALELVDPAVLARVQVHAFGEGEERESYADRVAQAALPVVFHPPVTRVHRLFSGFDAVVLPSRYEGLPLVALESLAAGTPILGTTAPGLIEATPPDWPLSVPPDDATALARAVEEVVLGVHDLAGLGRRGRAWAQEHFSFEGMVTAYLDAYAEYLARPARTI